MAQLNVTCPIQSPNKSPYQARPNPTALRGRVAPAVVLRRNIRSQRFVMGMTGFKQFSTAEFTDFILRGQSEYGTGGELLVYAPPTKLDSITGLWRLFSNEVDVATGNVPVNFGPGYLQVSYTGKYDCVGAGRCPQVSGIPMSWDPDTGDPVGQYHGWRGWRDGTPPLMGPFNAGDLSADTSMTAYGDYRDHSSLPQNARTLSGLVDPAGYYDIVKAELDGRHFDPSNFDSDSFGWNDAPVVTPGSDTSLLNPADYDGKLKANVTVANPFGSLGNAISGWLCAPVLDANGQWFYVMKEQCKLIGGIPNQLYTLIRIQSGAGKGNVYAPDLPSDIIARVSVIGEGVMHPGQTIGTGDSDITLPFPSSRPFPIQAMGTNGIVGDVCFALLAENPAPYLAGLGLKIGDNY